MAISTPMPTVETLPDSLPRDHPNFHVSVGLGVDEIACGEDKLACLRMEAEPGAGEASPPKKVKTGANGVETILRQTAEIEMVLVGMAALRGGAPPTPVECHLAVKAYSNLEGLVERVAPRDLVSKKFLQSLIQQFTMSQQPAVPLVSTLTPAQDISTSSMGASAIPASVKAASAPGKRTRVAVKTAKPEAAAKRCVSKNAITRLRDTQSVPITGTRVRVGKGPKSLLRGRGAKIAEPLIDQRQVHQQVALEIQHLLTQDAFMAALPETAGAYVNSPIRCGACEVLIHDTSSLLICDGCGSGFHLLCLQMYKPLDILEQDWYCTKCEAVTGGQPRQSMYGPLRRGPGRRGSRTTWILKSAEHPSAKAYPSTTALEYKLKLRNTTAAQDENLGAAKASSDDFILMAIKMNSYRALICYYLRLHLIRSQRFLILKEGMPYVPKSSMQGGGPRRKTLLWCIIVEDSLSSYKGFPLDPLPRDAVEEADAPELDKDSPVLLLSSPSTFSRCASLEASSRGDLSEQSVSEKADVDAEV